MEITLPTLPKKNKQLEAKFGIAFRKWLEGHPHMACTFEMKDTRGASSLPFSEVKDAQIRWGHAVSSDKGVLMRIEPIVEGMPDYAYFRNSPAYIVVKYPKMFCLISVGTFELESKRSKRRSLTAARARDISILTVDL
jgi:hypothetical protein